jgi:hypothetical protein
VRRAVRSGQRHLAFWDDLALSRITLGVICLVLLAAATLARGVQTHEPADSSATSLTVAVAVLTVASYGLGLQYLRLAAPTNHRSLMALAVFLLWGIPPLLAMIIQLTSGPMGSNTLLASVISGLSPITSLALMSQTDTPTRSAVQIAALIPAVGLPFVLSTLITTLHRRIDKAVCSAKGLPDASPEKPPVEFLAEV